MDYDKLIEWLRKEAYGSDFEELLLEAATAIETLRAENVKLQYEEERQRRSADNMRHLYENAERAYTKVQADIARVTAERDAAVKDMEALMWFSGEGCHICAHEIIIHKEPYVRSKCALGNCAACCPTWRGQKED